MLELYLWTNAILAVVSASFLLVVRANDRWGSIRHRDLAWLGQFLLCLSLVAPVCVRSLPKHTLPQATFNFQQMLREAGAPAKTMKRKMKPAPVLIAAPVPERRPVSFPFEKAMPWALMAGMAIASAWLLRQRRKLGRILRNSTSLHQLGRVRVAVSDEISVPFAARMTGMSWVVLPFSLLERPADFRLALRHEIQHHRQGDTHWAFAVEAIHVLFWCNPVLKLWKRTLCELQEFSCDAALLGRRGIAAREYGSCLVRVAEAALETSHGLVGTTGMAAGLRNPAYFKSFLRRRIDMLLQPLPTRSRKLSLLAIGTLLATLTLTLAYGARELNQEIAAFEPDPEIQKISDAAVSGAVARFGAEAGFAIVADPDTGRILAVSNTDLRAGGRKEAHWSLSQILRPASVLKALVVAAAMEKGVVKASDALYCENGTYEWDGHTYHDWKGFPKLTITEAVANSSNICVIKVAQKMGLAPLETALKNFGFGPGGSSEGFPESVPGFFGLSDEARESFRLATLTTGSALATTPLEIVTAFSAVANGGMLLKPLATSGEVPKPVRRVLSENTSREVRKMLASVVTDGTARRAKDSVYTMAGKTGTAQDPSFGPTKKSTDGNVGSFAGFAPVDHPRIVVYAGIIRPSNGDGGAHGAEHGVPVFREIAEKTLKLWGVPPDKP